MLRRIKNVAMNVKNTIQSFIDSMITRCCSCFINCMSHNIMNSLKLNKLNKINDELKQAVDGEGAIVCRNGLVSDTHDLSITSSKMVFSDGYIYGIQKLNGVEGVPLRLVRFEVK